MPCKQGSSHLRVAWWLPAMLVLANSQRIGYKPTASQEGKIFFWSSDAPLAKAVNELAPEAIQSTKVILGYIAEVEKAVLKRVANRLTRPASEEIRVCGNVPVKWGESVQRSFGIRGFPEANTSCRTDVRHAEFSGQDLVSYSLNEIYEALFKRGKSIKSNILAIAARLIDVDRNFTEPDFRFDFRYSTPTAQCVVHPACGVRIGEYWRLGFGIQNKPNYYQLPNLGRQLLLEYVRVSDNQLGDNLLMRLPERTIPRKIREDTTTLIASWRGSAQPNCFRRILIDENPAVLGAIEKLEFFVQQAADALTPSSVAILVLPLGLNLVPVSLLLDDVSRVGMLMYVLLSDVITVIPLAIKGVELINIKRTAHRDFVVRLATSIDSDGTPTRAAPASMWAAECRARQDFDVIGTIFVCLSLAFLVGGAVVEFWARRFAKRRRQRLRRTGKLDVLCEVETENSSAIWSVKDEFLGADKNSAKENLHKSYD